MLHLPGIGKLVATKAVGSGEMVDVQSLYKAEEGSAKVGVSPRGGTPHYKARGYQDITILSRPVTKRAGGRDGVKQ